MDFRPRRLPGLITGVSITVLGALLAALLAYRLVQTSVASLPALGMGFLIFVLFVVVCLFGVWSYGCWSLSYRLNRDGLMINWATTKHCIPLSQIKDVVLGEAADSDVKVKGINWFGHHVGQAWAEGIGDILFYSAHRSHKELVYVLTPSLAYAISPSDPQRFAQELKLHQNLGPLEEMRQSTVQWRILSQPFWRDRFILLLAGLALLLNASLFGYTFYSYPQLPELLPLGFTASGQINRVGLKSEVLVLPVGALSVIAANLVLGFVLHAKERLAAYLCLAGTILVQVLFWVATGRIIMHALVT
ncbi:MAG: hypothetical protein A2Y60_02155 [Chloroflexi bacterium RBG_13_54_9]|nr:MAG: hypothetical protein A2Y60_02155 [Chloroflexi bacterium RBG_13_54_9]